MIFKNYLKSFWLGLLIFADLGAATINLFNHSKYPVYFYIDVDNWFDKKIIVLPLESYTRRGFGDINKVKAIPLVPPVRMPSNCDEQKLDTEQPVILDKFLNDIKSFNDLEDSKQEIDSNFEDLEFKAPNSSVSLVLNQNRREYNVSFDLDENNNPILKRGPYGLEKAVNFLVISDVHTIAKTEQELSTMNLSLYGGNKKRERLLNKHRNKIALRDKMISYIQDASKDIRAVIMPGDSAGGYGKKSETEAFKYVWYNPLRSILLGVGGRTFMGLGNHDAYWSSLFEPKPTEMFRFVKSAYGDYNYSHNIGSMHFINLSLYPSLKKDMGVDPSLIFLINDLKYNVNRTRPIVIFFHYPTHGHMSDWWSPVEKSIFYNVIRSYNIVLIACGHSHKSAKYEFGDKKIPVILAAGREFAFVKWDPANPKAVDIKFVNAEGSEVDGSKRLNATGPKIRR